jgi:hypothetical protein
MNKPRARIRETMGWRVEVEDRIAELEHYRLLLEEASRSSARSISGPEGERLEAQVKNVIMKIRLPWSSERE